MAYSIKVKTPLHEKVPADWHRLDRHRAARERIGRAYIGDSHGLSEVGASRTPLNAHALYARSLIQYLAAKQPRLLISTDVGPWKPFMELIEFQGSRVMKEERFEFKQQRWVLDGLLYSPGVLKVCQEWRRVPVGDEGDYVSALKTLVANVDGSDLVFDTRATSWWDAEYVGHRVFIPVDDVIDNPMFGGISEEELRGMAGWRVSDDERFFFEEDDKEQPFREEIAFWEIHERCSNRIKIFPVDGGPKYIYDEPWDGHANGPLHPLDFLDIPNHVVGLSPLCVLHNLIEATNRALDKTIEQTDRAKSVAVIPTTANKAEAEALMEAIDGTGVYQSPGGGVQFESIPGPDRATMMMVPVLKDLFNWLGGNINELAGLGVSAPTATQGELLARAASGMVSHMQSRTHTAVRGVAEAIIQNELKDQIGTEYVPEKLADGQTNWRRFTPEQRAQIDGVLVDTDIDVYSMEYKSPTQRLQGLMQWWIGFAVPGYPIWQAQGGEYDMQALNRAYAKLSGLTEINDVALYSMRPATDPFTQRAQGLDLGMRQSPVTSRTNIRQDRGGQNAELGGDLAQSLARMEAA